MAELGEGRRRRANGEASRMRILDAAGEIAGERGYEGTSIALVSKKCGLPASSIYWHFKDKDDLIAAVIERSFERWLGALTLPGSEVGSPRERITALIENVAESFLETPEFLRLGLMLALERRPEEPSARTMFLRVREVALGQVRAALEQLAPDLDEDATQLLTTYTMAAADGLFIAKQIGGDGVDLVRLFELHAGMLIDAAGRLSAA